MILSDCIYIYECRREKRERGTERKRERDEERERGTHNGEEKRKDISALG